MGKEKKSDVVKYKEAVGAARGVGALIDWLPRFRAPLPGVERSWWEASPRCIIREVTCRILQPYERPFDPESPHIADHPEATEIWRSEPSMGSMIFIQTGLERLETGKLYILELDLPADSMYRSAGPAGPATGRALAELPPMRKNDIYDYQVRPARFWFEVEPLLDSAAGTKRICTVHDDEGFEDDRHRRDWRPPHARALLAPDPILGVNHVEVDWRPDWLRRGHKKNEPAITPNGGQKLHGGIVTHIVLHNTGGPDIGSTIGTFANDDGSGGIHYLIDLDGHVVKMCPETHGLSHCDDTFWRNKVGLNRRSIGIEHSSLEIGKEDVQCFTSEQMRVSIDLVRAIKTRHGIDGRNIVGHGEVRIIDKKEAQGNACARDSSRCTDIQKGRDLHFDYELEWGDALHPDARLVSCPGPGFAWEAFAAAGLVPEPRSTTMRPLYQEYIEANGPIRPGTTHEVVRQLVDDMRTIGYAIPFGPGNQNGENFTVFLGHAIKAFKARYLPAPKSEITAKVDSKTATLITAVVLAYEVPL